VTAKDGAADPRLATATVTVKIVDTEDELPIFHVPRYEVEVPENVPDYVVMQIHVSLVHTCHSIILPLPILGISRLLCIAGA